MKIVIASDHAGFKLKTKVKEYLENEKKFEVVDLGTDTPERTSYANYGKKLGKAIHNKEYGWGIVVCGTGIGISIAANRFKGVRAAICRNRIDAKLTRNHNNANVLSLGERLTTFTVAKEIIDEFFSAEFEGGRHIKRIEDLDN
ncbi:MAG: ribose 5-phosphate isomerase B [Mycoplasma sp.]|nr:ribose 5-phosphate isomerase B [Mycoplasma sp.]